MMVILAAKIPKTSATMDNIVAVHSLFLASTTVGATRALTVRIKHEDESGILLTDLGL